MILHSHVILSLKDAKWKLSKYNNFRSAEEWETTVTEVEMQKGTPQLKTDAQDLVSSAAMGRMCTLLESSKTFSDICVTSLIEDNDMCHFPSRRQLHV